MKTSQNPWAGASLVCLLVASGCASGGSGARGGSGLSYSTTRLPLETHQPDFNLTRAQLDQVLRKALRERGIRTLVVEQSSGTKIPLWNVDEDKEGSLRVISSDTAYALLIATAIPEGTELDMLTGRGATRGALTVYREGDGVLRFTAPVELKKVYRYPALSSPLMQSRFGVGPIEKTNRSFTKIELQVIGEALSVLSEAERSVLRDVPIRRERLPPQSVAAERPGWFVGGLYTYDGYRRWIEIYDGIVSVDGVRFVGTPDNPHPASTMVLVHEVGHALSRRDLALIGHEHDGLVRERDRLQRTQNALRRQRGTMDPRRYIALTEELNREVRVFNRRYAQFEHRAARVKRALRQGTRVAKDFAAVLPPEHAVTAYGQSSIEESFAEAFALYKLDPEALERISPEALDFFQQGRHVAGLEDAAGDTVAEVDSDVLLPIDHDAIATFLHGEEGGLAHGVCAARTGAAVP